MVSGINVETKSVTVEWFERGETKGKEVIKQMKMRMLSLSGDVVGLCTFGLCNLDLFPWSQGVIGWFGPFRNL